MPGALGRLTTCFVGLVCAGALACTTSDAGLGPMISGGDAAAVATFDGNGTGGGSGSTLPRDGAGDVPADVARGGSGGSAGAGGANGGAGGGAGTAGAGGTIGTGGSGGASGGNGGGGTGGSAGMSGGSGGSIVPPDGGQGAIDATAADATSPDAGVDMMIVVDPCSGYTCPPPPAPSCSNGKLTTHGTPGTCVAPGGVRTCNYPPTVTDCAGMNLVCDAQAGRCNNPCEPNPCTMSRAAMCADDKVLITYAATATCQPTAGGAQCGQYAPTMTDCTQKDFVCHNGACVDPCMGLDCNKANECVGAGLNTARKYTGMCTSPKGVPKCEYTDTNCADAGQVCQKGACVDKIVRCWVDPDKQIDPAKQGQVVTINGHVVVNLLGDPSTRLQAQMGWGSAKDQPGYWTWTAAMPASGVPVPGTFDYKADLTSPSPGTYFYGYRFSSDGNWVYCDVDKDDKFNNPGVLVVKD